MNDVIVQFAIDRAYRLMMAATSDAEKPLLRSDEALDREGGGVTPYWQQLRDPRWQRKRLEIMQRADFECEYCGAADQTLNVHHKVYRKGAPPWDYPSDQLVCICGCCHEEEHALLHDLQLMTKGFTLHFLRKVVQYAYEMRCNYQETEKLIAEPEATNGKD